MPALTLGIDTGGTFTDAALLATTDAGATSVIAAAKALTTRHDLLGGISDAVAATFAAAPTDAAAAIRLVGLSTTLATNAIVAGHGSPAGLLLIGQPAAILSRADLGNAVGNAPVAFINGGHNAAGDELSALDVAAVERAVDAHADTAAAFAVAGYFAVRNADHELRVRDIIARRSNRPVTCSHELSARLSAPRRALTALLNARLVPLLGEFIAAATAMLRANGINAALMVVQGDGSLITADAALRRPVETILSGPAASIIGARHLSDAAATAATAVVSDIGGTTTDIALLADGKPVLDYNGASVGGWQTLVEAVAVHTLGLGGDSEVRAAGARVQLGPRRAVPLCLLAARHPHVLATLQRQCETPPREQDGRFALRLRGGGAEAGSLSRSERAVWEALGEGPVAVDTVLDSPSHERALENLRRRELAVVAALTPTDAAHILGLHNAWSREAAVAGAKILLRRINNGGSVSDDESKKIAEKIIRKLVRRSAHAIGAAAINSDAPGSVENDYARAHYLHKKALDDGAQKTLVEHQLKLNAPLIGVGAAAATYYGSVAKHLHTRCEIPKHAEVCNAVGAVAGGIVRRVSALITAVNAATYRVHIQNGVKDFSNLEDAAAYAADECAKLATAEAEDAGGGDISVEHERRDNIVNAAGGDTIFVESFLSAIASGTPR